MDLDRASVARMYDYYLGGAHNLAVDRELADQVIAADPDVVRSARELRSFLRRAVRYCLDQGIDQFLDLGSGIPTVGNIHEIAHREHPTARIAYVDNDLVAVNHSREVLHGLGTASITLADLRDAQQVLTAPTVAELLDFSRPVAVLMVAVLHFMPDTDTVRQLVADYRRATAPGGALIIAHGSADYPDYPELAHAMRERVAPYKNSTHSVTLRSRAELGSLFEGFEIAEPGMVDITRWRPDTGAESVRPVGAYGAVGNRPRRGLGLG